MSLESKLKSMKVPKAHRDEILELAGRIGDDRMAVLAWADMAESQFSDLYDELESQGVLSSGDEVEQEIVSHITDVKKQMKVKREARQQAEAAGE